MSIATEIVSKLGLKERDDLVIAQPHPSIWTFSTPFLRSNLFPIGGRTTAVQLSNGSYFVVASTNLTPQVLATLSSSSNSADLPQVSHLIAPDSVHYLFLSDWTKAFPQAKVYGPRDLVNKKENGLEGWLKSGVDLQAQRVFGGLPETPNPKEKRTGLGGVQWGKEPGEDEIEIEYFGGFVNQDIAILHKPSKTLIQADLLWNLPAHEQFSKSPLKASTFWMTFLPSLTPWSWFHKWFVKMAGVDKDAMAISARRVADWDFTRVIPCHGDIIHTGGKEAWKKSYANYLKEDQKTQ